MNELIAEIAALKAKAKDQCDLESPHVGNALSALDAAGFCLRNEKLRLDDAAKVATKSGEVVAKRIPLRP